MIRKETIDKIFEIAAIEEVVGDFVNLKKRGANLLGNCPFHNEKTPSFTVSPSKGIYKCFGCGKAGNSVNFIMEHEKLTYPDALRQLAKKYNIAIEEDETISDEDRDKYNHRESLMLTSDFAKKFFVDTLWNSEYGQTVGLSYFKERAFREDIVKKFELGFSPQEWSGLTEAAKEAGFEDRYLIETGLSILHEEKKSVYDRFRNRVMFPIHNITGRVIAFGGRILATNPNSPKYVNSPESEIYHKSNVLYGIYFAKKTIRDLDNCFLVEGYTDVVSLHQSGIENVVASSGTSLTTEQIRLIGRFTKNITILYDGDPAGIKASLRGIDMILEEGLNVKIVLFPDGHDPDSYVRSVGGTAFQEYVLKTQSDFIVFKTNLLLADTHNDPIKKADLIRDIVESIAKIPDAIKASLFIKECSKLMDMDERLLLSELNKFSLKKVKKANNQEELSTIGIESEIQATPIVKENRPNDSQEKEVIRILVNYANQNITLADEAGKPQSISIAAYILQVIEQEQLAFVNEPYIQLLGIIQAAIADGVVPSQTFFSNHSNQIVATLSAALLSSPHNLSERWKEHDIYIPQEEKILEKVVKSALNHLRLNKSKKLFFEIGERLKENLSEEETTMYLQTHMAMREQIKFFERELGLVILK
jgi:DNA primase